MLLIRHAESEWNRVVGACRIDPGMPDPAITAEGALAAREAAATLADAGIARLVASPYRRTLQTAAILAEALALPVLVEPLARERCAFTCDQGTPRSQLAAEWPELALDGLEERWWGTMIESVASLERRAAAFLARYRDDPLRDRTAVVTHWGFIRCVSGQEVGNLHSVRLTFGPTLNPQPAPAAAPAQQKDPS